VVHATGQDDARVRLGAAINRVVPRYNIYIGTEQLRSFEEMVVGEMFGFFGERISALK
jgi:hypothetical protein